MLELDIRNKSKNERIAELTTKLNEGFIVMEGKEKDVLQYTKDTTKDIIHLVGHDRSHVKGGGYEDYLVMKTSELMRLHNMRNDTSVITIYRQISAPRIDDIFITDRAIPIDAVATHLSDILYNECHCLSCTLEFGGGTAHMTIKKDEEEKM